MKVKIQECNNCVCGIPLTEFPEGYVLYHKGIEQHTKILVMCLERSGAELLKRCLAPAGSENSDKFLSDIKIFIKAVLRWGGKQCLAKFPKICRSEKNVADAICEAAVGLENNDLALAVKILCEVDGISISIGSKILRIMSPEKAGAFDIKVLRTHLSYGKRDGYSDDYAGYAAFCEHCREMAVKLNRRHIKHPIRGDSQWRAADVESVIYRHLGW